MPRYRGELINSCKLQLSTHSLTSHDSMGNTLTPGHLAPHCPLNGWTAIGGRRCRRASNAAIMELDRVPAPDGGEFGDAWLPGFTSASAVAPLRLARNQADSVTNRFSSPIVWLRFHRGGV